jgi:hypothetical protein
MLDITKPENLELLFVVNGIITEDDSSDFDSEIEEEENN